MSLYTRLKASLTESICKLKHLEEQDMVEFNYELSEEALRVLELENELGEKDAEIEELKTHIKTLEKKIKDHYGQSYPAVQSRI